MNHPAEVEEVAIADIFRFLARYWLMIGCITLVGGVVATIFAYTTKPVYRAEVLISPAAADNASRSTIARLAEQLGPISGMLGGLSTGGGASGKDVWIAMIRSRKFTEEFIRDLHLLPILFSKQWDHANNDWLLGESGKRRVPSMENAYMLFDGSVRHISEDRKTGLITLAVQWTDPELAANWANELVIRANEAIRLHAIAESQASIDFLKSELKKTEIVGLQEAIYRLIESKVSEIVVANVRKDYAFVVIDPAQPPGRNNFVKPRRRLMMAIGVLLGFLVGCICALLFSAMRERRATAQ